MNEVNYLIKEEEWHNIPAPVKETITGLIDFTKKISTKLIQANDVSQRRVFSMDDRVKKLENQFKSRFDMYDQKLAREIKTVKDYATKGKDESKGDLTILKDANQKLTQLLRDFEGKVVKLGKKIK